MRVLLAASLVLSLGVHPAFGGAWTQQAGGYYLKLQTGYLNSTEDLDANGDRGPKGLLGGSFKDVNYSAYVEYGLIEGTTVVATLPYKRLDDEHTFASGTAREKRSGFGDLELRLRQRIREGPVVLSVAVGARSRCGMNTTRNPCPPQQPEGRLRRTFPGGAEPLPAAARLRDGGGGLPASWRRFQPRRVLWRGGRGLPGTPAGEGRPVRHSDDGRLRFEPGSETDRGSERLKDIAGSDLSVPPPGWSSAWICFTSLRDAIRLRETPFSSRWP